MMKNKFFISILIILGGFAYHGCSSNIDIGDSLEGVFHTNWPYCYKVLNSLNDEPIIGAKTIAKYLNENGETIEIVLITNIEGFSCHNWYDFIYAEISAQNFETIIFDNGYIPTTVKLKPL
jgi:hypothetical protein